MSFLQVMQGVVNYLNRMSILIDQHTQSFHISMTALLQRLKPTRRSNIRRTHQEQQRDTPAVTAGCAGLVVIAAAATTAAAAATAETKSEVHLLHCSLEQRVGSQVCLSDDQSATRVHGPCITSTRPRYNGEHVDDDDGHRHRHINSVAETTATTSMPPLSRRQFRGLT
ncbi:hypothetical protein BHM03_00013710 [Ensete ventricosum]|uniref:Uncharacterized protein n=1 Tax=Ensete ventricosum TaxID=4639 RepID=A0A445MDY5_ENSVE|nr:hypothetical protein BHM03_00013710 [Ensete ventricosum]